jgi:hypothetical protein
MIDTVQEHLINRIQELEGENEALRQQRKVQGQKSLNGLLSELSVRSKMETNLGRTFPGAENETRELNFLVMMIQHRSFGVEGVTRLFTKFLTLTEKWSEGNREACTQFFHYLDLETPPSGLFAPFEALAAMSLSQPELWGTVIISQEPKFLDQEEDGSLCLSPFAAFEWSSAIRRMYFDFYHVEKNIAWEQKLHDGHYTFVHQDGQVQTVEPEASDSNPPVRPKGRVRVAMISDTHLYHRKYSNLPAADVLVHAGDFEFEASRAEPGLTRSQFDSFLNWISSLDQFKYKILIGGNHDWTAEQMGKEKRQSYFSQFSEQGNVCVYVVLVETLI